MSRWLGKPSWCLGLVAALAAPQLRAADALRVDIKAWLGRLDAAATPQPLTVVAFGRSEGEAAAIKALGLPEQLWGQVHSLSPTNLQFFRYSLLLNAAALRQTLADTPQSEQPAQAARSALALSGADLALDLGARGQLGGPTERRWTLWSATANGVRKVYEAARRGASTLTLAELAAFLRAAFGYDGVVLAHDGELVLARLPGKGWPLGTAALVLTESAPQLRLSDSHSRRGTYLLRLVQVDGDLAVLKVVAAPQQTPIPVGSKLVQQEEPVD